jgi:uncharacterized membrane protein
MAGTQQRRWQAENRSGGGHPMGESAAPLRPFIESQRAFRSPHAGVEEHPWNEQNVSQGERLVSAVAGAILALQGVARRDLTGALIAGVGGALIYRGATGHCAAYRRLGVNTAQDGELAREAARPGVHITESFLIERAPEELYNFWRNFENFPQFMTHLESVKKIDDRRSHWIAKAPSIYGGKVEWDAEITAEEPNSRIAWRALPDSDVQHRGEVRFTRARGDRGTMVRVEMDYTPPAGQVGRWVAKLFGEEPEQQVRDDVRNFKRLMETDEVPTIEGQPHGTCLGRGVRS